VGLTAVLFAVSAVRLLIAHATIGGGRITPEGDRRGARIRRVYVIFRSDLALADPRAARRGRDHGVSGRIG
jgi:hypothetical protein